MSFVLLLVACLSQTFLQSNTQGIVSGQFAHCIALANCPLLGHTPNKLTQARLTVMLGNCQKPDPNEITQ